MRLFGRRHFIVFRQHIRRNTYHIVEHGPFAGIFGAVKVGGIDTVFGKGVAVAGFGKGPFVFTKEFAPHFAKRAAQAIAQAVNTLAEKSQTFTVLVATAPRVLLTVGTRVVKQAMASIFAKFTKTAASFAFCPTFGSIFTAFVGITSTLSGTKHFTHSTVFVAGN